MDCNMTFEKCIYNSNGEIESWVFKENYSGEKLEFTTDELKALVYEKGPQSGIVVYNDNLINSNNINTGQFIYQCRFGETEFDNNVTYDRNINNDIITYGYDCYPTNICHIDNEVKLNILEKYLESESMKVKYQDKKEVLFNYNGRHYFTNMRGLDESVALAIDKIELWVMKYHGFDMDSDTIFISLDGGDIITARRVVDGDPKNYEFVYESMGAIADTLKIKSKHKIVGDNVNFVNSSKNKLFMGNTPLRVSSRDMEQFNLMLDYLACYYAAFEAERQILNVHTSSKRFGSRYKISELDIDLPDISDIKVNNVTLLDNINSIINTNADKNSLQDIVIDYYGEKAIKEDELKSLDKVTEIIYYKDKVIPVVGSTAANNISILLPIQHIDYKTQLQ